MKILHVVNHFLPGQVAGTEVYVWALSKQLQSLCCEVGVVLPNYDSDISSSYEYDEIPVFKYAEPSIIDRSLIAGKRLPDGLKNFVQHLKETRPDIVHFHEIAGSCGIGVAHFEAAKSSGAKVVFTMHLAGNTCRTGVLMYEGKSLCNGAISEMKCAHCALVQKTGSVSKAAILSKASLPFYRFNINPANWNTNIGTALSYPFQITRVKNNLERIIKACDKLIPITDWYYNMLIRNGVPSKKLKVILQALPVSPGYIPAPSNTSNQPVKLIFVGRVDELKGMSLLLNVVKEFSQNELVLDIYGDGPDKEYVDNCKAITANYQNIRWKGKIAQGKVVATMTDYHALILPSMFSEMSPLVIQEASAARIPVIGSNVYGIAEQVKDGVTGLLFDFGSAVSLKSVLKRVVQDGTLLQQLAANTRPPRHFKEVAEETLDVYQSVLQQKEVAH